MNLEKLAVSLGLPKESPEASVFEAVAKRDAEGRAAVESLAALRGELPKHGFTLDAKGLPVRVEPLKLDIKEGDDDEKKELKRIVREAQEKELAAGLSSNKDFVLGLSKKLGMPPSMIALAEDILGVRGELEALTLSKDGKVEVKKTAELPKKLRSFMEQLSAFPGLKLGKTETAEPKADDELSREERLKLAKEVVASVSAKE